MTKKLLAIIVIVILASLSVAGCTVGVPSTSSPTPTATPTPTPTSTPIPAPVDYSSSFNKNFEGAGAIMERPFTKSTNQRGNDVYKGITRNTALAESSKMTTVVELTKSQAEAKQLYDQTIAQKLSEGFIVNHAWIAQAKAADPGQTDIWAGSSSAGQQFYAAYGYISYVYSWTFMTESGTKVTRLTIEARGITRTS
jgi:hypothetical protein